MTLLGAGELAQIRAEFEACFDSTATVLGYARTPDGGGGFTEAWTPGVTVAANIAPVGGGESGSRGGRVDARTTNIVTLPAGTVVGAVDRLLVNGVTYEITAVRTRTDEFTRRCEVKEASPS